MLRSLYLTLSGIIVSTPAFAHTGVGDTHGFAHGFMHPISGVEVCLWQYPDTFEHYRTVANADETLSQSYSYIAQFPSPVLEFLA